MTLKPTTRIVIQFVDSQTGERSELASPQMKVLLEAIQANDQDKPPAEDLPPNPLMLVFGTLDEQAEIDDSQDLTRYPLVHTHSFFETHKHLLQENAA